MKDWKKILVKEDVRLEEAIKVLHSGGAQIVLVYDNQDKLIGTVTDGDIRRALLKDFSMDIKVCQIMNTNPTSVLDDISDNDIKDIMTQNNLFHVPIVDTENKIKGLKLLHELINNKKFDNTIFILAGGFGKRLMPLTKNTPKPMLKINNVPILESVISNCISNGFNNFVISTFYKSDKIKNYFGNGKNKQINIDYITEDKPLGTAGSLGLLPKRHLSLPIIVMNADILSKVNLRELLVTHNNSENHLTICSKEYKMRVPFGVIVSKKSGIVERIDEKPDNIFHINAGIYVINPDLLLNLDGDTYCDMPDFIKKLKPSVKIKTFPLYEDWLDIGNKADFEGLSD